jgi:aminopeptidase N
LVFFLFDSFCFGALNDRCSFFFSPRADVRGSATSLDAMRSSHAIEVDVHHPAEINEIFDTISYAKGGTVIRVRTCGLAPAPVTSH